MTCPSCGSEDDNQLTIQVTFTGTVTIAPGGDDFEVMDSEPQDSEWDDDSEVYCDCGWAGKVGELS